VGPSWRITSVFIATGNEDIKTIPDSGFKPTQEVIGLSLEPVDKKEIRADSGKKTSGEDAHGPTAASKLKALKSAYSSPR
jgi:hypothetical protein